MSTLSGSGGQVTTPVKETSGPEGEWFMLEWVTGKQAFLIPGVYDEVDLLTLVREEPFISVKDNQGTRVFVNVDQILAFRRL